MNATADAPALYLPPVTPCNIEFAIPPAHGLMDLRERFGPISVEGGNVVAPHGWEAANMVKASDLPLWGPRTIYCNKAIVAPLREALNRCAAASPGYVLDTMGCFAPRAKRGNGDEYSVHSWGLAVDINAATNPRAPGSRGDIPAEWVAAFESVGFVWGGRFRGTPDPMHMQWCSGY